jgi:hypothetical protein
VTVPYAARRRPDGRYDQPSRAGQRVLAVLLGVLFVGLLIAVFAALYGRFVGREDVRGRVISFDVQSDALVLLDVEASKAAGGKAYCVIRARGASGAEVGRDVAVLDPAGSQDRVVRGDFRLATTSRAVTGELAQCTDVPITRADVTR